MPSSKKYNTSPSVSSAKKYKLSPSMSHRRQSNTVPIMIGLFVFIIIIGSTITTVIFLTRLINRTNNIVNEACTGSCTMTNALTPNNIPACIAKCSN